MKMPPCLVALIALALALPLLAEEKSPVPSLPPHTRQDDVIYGRKLGLALTLDVIQPESPNGAGILYIVSGGWFSGGVPSTPPSYAEFLKRGYTVFSVRHGSQPKFTILEILQDIHRAVRYVRHHAAKWQVAPEKLGISGGSAGCHLSLMIGVQGGPGNPEAPDPVDRESSAVQAVAGFYPPTDFLNYGQPGVNAVGVGILERLKPAFGPESDTEEGRFHLGRAISPFYHLSEKLPPTLLIHGDRDELVPLQQSEIFVAKAKELGATAELIVKPGVAHGWPSLIQDYASLADWFDRHLRGLETGPATPAGLPQ